MRNRKIIRARMGARVDVVVEDVHSPFIESWNGHREYARVYLTDAAIDRLITALHDVKRQRAARKP